jgi:ribosomal protein S18 acetylase RimI-like enzyme
MSVEIRQADLSRPSDGVAVVEVLDSYARDARGDSQPLTDSVRRQLLPALRAHPTTVIFLAYDHGDAIGVAICFRGLSTFRARPLLNIHDLAIVPSRRNQGIGRALLRAAESYALSEGCCKLTLEVQDDNSPALGLYRSFGFGDFFIAGATHRTVFLQKALGD